MVPGRAAVLRAGLALLAILALLAVGREGAGLLPGFASRVQGTGAWGMVAYAAGYALAVVALVPASVLTLAAGALFGLAGGTAVAFGGALAGAALAFLAARYLIRPQVERRVRTDPRARRLDDAAGAGGLRLVLLLRLSPVIPFSLLNYALGVTRVRTRDYLLGSLGMLPGTVLYVWAGKAAGDVAAAAGGAGVPRGAGYWALMAVGLIATAAVSVAAARAARRALREARVDADER